MKRDAEKVTHLFFIESSQVELHPLVCSFLLMSHVRSIAFLSFIHSFIRHFHALTSSTFNMREQDEEVREGEGEGEEKSSYHGQLQVH